MSYPPPAMSVQTLSEPQTLAQVPFKVLEETIRQLRSTRNDIIRYGVWNVRNITDEEFNRTDDRKLLGYFPGPARNAISLERPPRRPDPALALVRRSDERRRADAD